MIARAILTRNTCQVKRVEVQLNGVAIGEKARNTEVKWDHSEAYPVDDYMYPKTWQVFSEANLSGLNLSSNC